MRMRWFNFLVLLSLILGLLPVTAAQAASETAPLAQPAAQAGADIEVESALRNQLAADETAGYMIYFKEKPDLSPAYKMDWIERGRFVANALHQTALRSQTQVRAYLDAQGAKYKTFWIDNVIVVESSNMRTFNALSSFPEISALRSRREPVLHEPVEIDVPTDLPINLNAPAAIEPNLLHIDVDDVWGLGYSGAGIVVANIDTGVRYTHQALVNQYRGSQGGGAFDHNYNWWDPYDHDLAPNDTDSHGSHTMGTMIGDDGGANQIGMAPGATWMACQGFNPGATDAGLLECAQFLAAPWDLTGANANPDLRPNIINNSWGSCGNPTTYDPWYEGVVATWHAMGIYPVFSNGNVRTTPACPQGVGQVGNPARYASVTGVGALGASNATLASYSLWGPTDQEDTINPRGYPYLKPQVSAPGTNRSAYNTSDTAYGGMSGTSMASPHVVGLIALMWEAGPCLVGDYAATETILEETTTATSWPGYLGHPSDGPDGVPNQATGWGEINALAAVQAAEGFCGDSVITGEVLDAATNATIAGVTILATNDAGTTQRKTTSNDLGVYVLNVFSDTYTLEASRYGYQTTVVPDVAATAGATTTQHIAMTPANFYEVSGQVTDAATGWPLYAHISITGDPVDPAAPNNAVWTDPATGEYSVMLSEGVTYTFEVAAWVPGYTVATGIVGPLTTEAIADFALQADILVCAAPGYNLQTTDLLVNSFEGATAGTFPADGWDQVEVSGTAGNWTAPTAGTSPAATPHSGSRLASFNSYNASSGSSTRLWRTPTGIDLTGITSPRVEFWFFHGDCGWNSGDNVQLQTSTDVGVTWVNVGMPVVQKNSGGWERYQIDLSAYAGNTDLRVGLLGISQFGCNMHVDDVRVFDGVCVAPTDGGLVVGNVYDANYPTMALNGASVVNASGGETTAVATPLDAAVDDAFYTLFAPSGAQVFTATMVGGYGTDVATVTVVDGGTVAQGFQLPAGLLDATPDGVAVTVELGYATSTSVSLENTGGADALFELVEIERPFVPTQLDRVRVTLPGTSRTSTSVGMKQSVASASSIPERTFDVPITRIMATTRAVLLLTPDADISDLASVLAAFPDVAVTTYSGNLATLTAAELQPYDVVMITNNGRWSAAGADVVVGNALADYVDMGGKVVVNNYAYDWAGWELAGRFITEGYGPFTMATSDYSGSSSLGTIYEPGHPIIAGVSNVTNRYLWQNQGLAAGATRIADWNNGSIFVAVKQNVVGLNILPSDGAGTPGWTGDLPTLYHNAILWLTSNVGDVPWLAEVPVAGTVAASGNTAITVDFDAAYVDKPGEYHAELIVNNDTPYGKFSIPVTMTVIAPDTRDTVEGLVQGLGYCDVMTTPLEGAVVFVESTVTTDTWSVETGADGTYGIWLDELYSPFTVTIAYEAGYSEQVFTDVEIISGTVTTLDANLVWLQPCISVAPDALAVSVEMGTVTTLDLNLANLGAFTGTFEINERNLGFEMLGPLATGGPDSFGYRFADSNTAGISPVYDFVDISGVGMPLALGDNDYAEIDIGFDFKFYGASAVDPNVYDTVFVGSNGFLSFGAGSSDLSPDPVLPDPTLPNNLIAAAWDNLVPGTVYVQNFPQCPYNPAGTAVEACFIVQYDDFSHADSSPAGTWEVILFRSGSILMQYAEVDAPNATTGIEGPLGIVGLNYGPALADELAICFAYPGEEMNCQSDQVSWLSVDVDEGDIAAYDDVTVVVTFDATVAEVALPGDYLAELRVETNDPQQAQFVIPVTMTVVQPTDLVRLEGIVTAWSQCDAVSQTLACAQVNIVTSSGDSFLLTTNADGAYAVWLTIGDAYTITVSYPDYVPVTLTGTAQMVMLPHNVALRVNMPCISLSPTSYDVTLPKDRSTTRTFSIHNTGAGDFAYNNITGSSLWLSVLPKSGMVPGDSTTPVTLTFDATGLAAGSVYSTVLQVIHTNPDVGLLLVRPVRLTVLDAPQVLVDVVKTVVPADFVLPGGLITYTVVFTNSYDMPLDLTATDPIPANTTYVLGSVSGATVADPPGNVVTWAGSLEAGASATFSFVVRVNDDVTLGTMITNTVTVTANDLPFTAEAVVRVGRPVHIIYLPLVMRNVQ